MFDTTKTYLIVHQGSQLALQAQIQQNNSKSTIQLGTINQNNPNQMWIIEEKTKKRYQIILGFPDLLLTADGTQTKLKKGFGDRWHQYWQFDTSNNKGVKIMQCKHDRCYLGVSNNRIVIKKNPPIQAIDYWQFRFVTKNQQLNRCCYIQCTITGRLMDVPSSKQAEGVHICLWEANYRFNQRWKIYNAGQVYIIKSFKTDLNLEIEGQKYADGTKIIQWHSTGSHNQFWILQKRYKDIYRISSWYDPSLQIGNNEKNLYIHKGQKYLWKIIGHIDDF